MKFLKKIGFIILVCFLFVGMKQFQSLAYANRPYNPQTAGLYPVSHPEILKMIAMGNHQTLGDFYWIKLILKIGQADELGHYMMHHDPDHPGEHHHHGPEMTFSKQDTIEYNYLKQIMPDILFDHVNGITDLDPKFGYPYHTAITFLLFNYKDYPKAEYMMDKAISNNPDYWEFHFFKAFYLYRYKDAPDSLIIPHLENSVKATKSLRLFHKNLSLNLLIAFKKKLGETEKQIAFLEGLLKTIRDEDLKHLIMEEIEKLLNEKK